MSGWKFPLLALLFLAFCNTFGNASADGHDLEISGSGDDGITSYASQHGTAVFTISISSMTDSAHTNVAIDATVDWGDVTTEASVTDCDGDNAETDFGEGGTIEACISVSVAEAGADIGDVGAVTVSATSAEDSIGDSMEFVVEVTNWYAYSDDDAKTFEINTTHTYTIMVENIKVDENGDPVAIDDAISISPTTVGSSWDIDSADATWDKEELTATINYIAADADYDLVLDIKLVSSLVPASSYVGNSFVVFTVQDGTIYTLVPLEAIVLDHFETEITGSGDTDVDNGCEDSEAAIYWSPTVKNFGNTMDSFTVTFDISDADTAGWTVDDATDFNTGNLGARFESPENEYSLNLGLHVPGGLPSGTSHGFTMTVTSDTDSSVTQTQSFSATVTQCYGLTMTVDKASDSANPGSSVDFTISVTNGGNGDDTVSLATMGASEWSPTLAESELTIASGATSTTLLSVTVPSDASANAASGSVMVHAYSEGCGEDTTDCDYEEHVSVSVTANQVYGLTAGYDSNEDTASVQEGKMIQMKFTVTNNGNGNDEIALSLANAPEWVTLGQTTALVGPGQTMTLTVDVAAPASDAHGDHTFQVTATSADGTTSSTTGDLTVTVRGSASYVYGCMNPTAMNYNESAEIDDGSCVFNIYGCMDTAAVNFVPEANTDDNTCKYAPVAIAGKDITVIEGEIVQFGGAGTDSDGTIVKYEWDFDGDGIFEWSSEKNGISTFFYNDGGEYYTTLKVTDNEGNTATDSRTVTVIPNIDEGQGGKDAGESFIPSLSLMPILSLICLLAISRRR